MGTRMAYGFDFTDLGFRLEDIKGLPSEEVSERTSIYKACRHLKECGATDEEINFLIGKESGNYWGGWQGQRLELNAMMSDEFIKWLKKKLKKHGVEKVIPDTRGLAAAYCLENTQTILQTSVNFLDLSVKILKELTLFSITTDDRNTLLQMIDIGSDLKNQGSFMIQYMSSKNKQDLDNYELNRKQTWEKISNLMDLK